MQILTNTQLLSVFCISFFRFSLSDVTYFLITRLDPQSLFSNYYYMYGWSLTCIKHMYFNGQLYFVTICGAISAKGIKVIPNNNCGMIYSIRSPNQANCPIHRRSEKKLQLNISICYYYNNTLSVIKLHCTGYF